MHQALILTNILSAFIHLALPVTLIFWWVEGRKWYSTSFARENESFKYFIISLSALLLFVGVEALTRVDPKSELLALTPIGILLVKLGLILSGLLGAILFIRLINSIEVYSDKKREIQRALELSEQRFNIFMDNSPFIVFKKELTQEGDCRIIYQNNQCQKVFGNLLGKLDKDYLDPNTYKEISKSDLTVFESQQPIEVIEKLPVSFYGVTRLSYWKLTKFKTPRGIGCIGIDISEQVKIERELREKNQELELFSSVASHDLQAPLRGILQFTERLQSDLDELESADLPEERRALLKNRQSELINRTINSAKHMRELCERLLILCRIEKTESPLVATDLDDSLNIALNNLEALVIESHAQIIKKDVLPMVIGDPVQLFQLFQNLISNSIKYKKDDCNPVITIGCEEYQNPKTGIKECVVSIQDNGIGIESEHLDRIFNGFTRLHQSDEYPGFGLGLAICKKIVDRHTGKIWLNSTPGEGTTFYFTVKKYAARNRDSISR